MKHKNIVTIKTAPTDKRNICVVDMLTDEELVAARKERPDLIFTLGRDLPPVEEPVRDSSEPSIYSLDNPKGYTVRGMVMPRNLDEIMDDLTKESSG